MSFLLAEQVGFEPTGRKAANGFRVRLVMTTSILLHIFSLYPLLFFAGRTAP